MASFIGDDLVLALITLTAFCLLFVCAIFTDGATETQKHQAEVDRPADRRR